MYYLLLQKLGGAKAPPLSTVMYHLLLIPPLIRASQHFMAFSLDSSQQVTETFEDKSVTVDYQLNHFS